MITRYRLKRDIHKALDTLFELDGSEDFGKDFSLDSKTISSSIPLPRKGNHKEFCRITFFRNDFDVVFEYDPFGWNEYPHCIPTEDEEGEYFVCRCRGIDSKNCYPYSPILCRFTHSKFWSRETNYDVDEDRGSFEDNTTEPFYFKKVIFPEEL